MSQTNKRYQVRVPYVSSAVIPAQYSRRYRAERRIKFWRAMAVLFSVAAVLISVLALGGFDWIYQLF